MTTARQRGIRAVVVAAAILFVAGLLSAGVAVFIDVRPEATLDPERLRREFGMAWIARLLLLLSFAWLAIGMIAARTSLVGKPGAAAARASWLAVTRPWRARESMLGSLALDRVLLIAVPVALLVGTGIVQTAFLPPWPLALVFVAYLLFGVTFVLLTAPRSPWPGLAAAGGAVIGQCIVVLIGIGIAGPLGFAAALWQSPMLRVIVFALVLALIVWMAVAAGGALSAQVGARVATGTTLVAVGIGLAVPGLVVAAIGPGVVERAWRDPMIEVTLPLGTFWVLGVLGIAVVVAGFLLRRSSPRTP